MTVRTQGIYAAFENVAGTTEVTVVASDWTLDYEGLTEAASQKISIYEMAEETDPTRTKSRLLGEATFDDEAESLQTDDIELSLKPSLLSEYGIQHADEPAPACD